MANDFFFIADAYSMLTHFGISKGNGKVKKDIEMHMDEKERFHDSYFDLRHRFEDLCLSPSGLTYFSSPCRLKIHGN